MEMTKEFETLEELLQTKQYTKVRQYLWSSMMQILQD